MEKYNFFFSFCAAASGPVRLFTPYKRRRRNLPNVEQSPNNIQAKQKKQSEEEVEHDQGIVTKEETTWESITDGIDGTSEYIDSSSQSKLNAFALSPDRLINDLLKLFVLFCQFLLNLVYLTIA